MSSHSSFLFFCERYGDHRDLHSFPTRRSSDLSFSLCRSSLRWMPTATSSGKSAPRRSRGGGRGDRKSTRLNSSHVKISYAVFCLKKKRKSTSPPRRARCTTASTTSLLRCSYEL